MISARVITIFLLILLLVGCIDTGDTNRKDETGQKTIIAYVDAEEVFLISVMNKVTSYLEYYRTVKTVLYQPSPDELLNLEFTAFSTVVLSSGLSQPGGSIKTSDILALAEEMAITRGKEIVSRLRVTDDFESAVTEFKLSKPSGVVRMIKGSNPGYDEPVWKAKIGDINGPVVHYDRVLIFKVIERGVNERGEDWADIQQIDFLFMRNKARKQLEKELSDEWNIRIVDGFYSALDDYFEKDYSKAKTTLKKYIKKGKVKNGLACFLMARIIEKQNEPDTDNEILEYCQLAIDNCSDIKLKPHFQYEIALYNSQMNNPENAKAGYRASFDNLKVDIDLATKLLRKFEDIADDEYIAKSLEKLDALKELSQAEKAKQPEAIDTGNTAADDLEST